MTLAQPLCSHFAGICIAANQTRELEKEKEKEKAKEKEREMSIENAGMLEGLNWSDNSTGSGLLIFCASTATQQKC